MRSSQYTSRQSVLFSPSGIALKYGPIYPRNHGKKMKYDEFFRYYSKSQICFFAMPASNYETDEHSREPPWRNAYKAG